MTSVNGAMERCLPGNKGVVMKGWRTNHGPRLPFFFSSSLWRREISLFSICMTKHVIKIRNVLIPEFWPIPIPQNPIDTDTSTDTDTTANTDTSVLATNLFMRLCSLESYFPVSAIVPRIFLEAWKTTFRIVSQVHPRIYKQQASRK